ncbi:MAG TPA: Ppx/GppA phosphatase family protein [Actinocrinis sp.]|uniref:Ppx/GppA phosphatase family protein n=1 Tax=Actinocrinis sp. TaxID=1920516 RepID=UPI002D57F87F|nr:Ppx/GppA phosphatase family protein [Actinocrinis sp.]HZU55930.1 Ppx/GppA phosphatase family protein [Actinocrinis sp.]
MSIRVAAIDCGTNSIRLLVTDLDPQTGAESVLTRRMEIVRLGQGVDATGRLAPEALQRTFAACDDYAAEIRRLGAERIRFVATSATRDAANRDEFVAGVRSRLGVEPEVISGSEEAALSFSGATRAVAAASGNAESAAAGGHPTPYLVVDIGGGSTEFVLGDREVKAARSVDIGCVRLTERHLTEDPPTPAQVAAARRDIDAAIDLAAEQVPIDQAKTLVGVAGSVTTVSAIALGLPEYDPDRVHLSRISADTVRRVAGDLLASTHAQRAANPVIHPGRVDVIGAGALILAQIVDRLGLAEVVVSEHDILDGIALSQL